VDAAQIATLGRFPENQAGHKLLSGGVTGNLHLQPSFFATLEIIFILQPMPSRDSGYDPA
jgi:hypothetical protein